MFKVIINIFLIFYCVAEKEQTPKTSNVLSSSGSGPVLGSSGNTEGAKPSANYFGNTGDVNSGVGYFGNTGGVNSGVGYFGNTGGVNSGVGYFGNTGGVNSGVGYFGNAGGVNPGLGYFGNTGSNNPGLGYLGNIGYVNSGVDYFGRVPLTSSGAYFGNAGGLNSGANYFGNLGSASYGSGNYDQVSSGNYQYQVPIGASIRHPTQYIDFEMPVTEKPKPRVFELMGGDFPLNIILNARSMDISVMGKDDPRFGAGKDTSYIKSIEEPQVTYQEVNMPISEEVIKCIFSEFKPNTKGNYRSAGKSNNGYTARC